MAWESFRLRPCCPGRFNFNHAPSAREGKKDEAFVISLRTNVDQHIKRNLIIFVTARLVNPGGQPVSSNEEVEESEDVIEPPILPEVPFYKK
jgi:hypothetical protein